MFHDMISDAPLFFGCLTAFLFWGVIFLVRKLLGEAPPKSTPSHQIPRPSNVSRPPTQSRSQSSLSNSDDSYDSTTDESWKWNLNDPSEKASYLEEYEEKILGRKKDDD